MKYGKIYYCDIANGIGIRTSLFVSGCTHHCKECFNPETWDFHYGEEFTPEVENLILDSLKPNYVKGISILGGEPWELSNQAVLFPFMQKIKEKFPDKTIWIYSGYTLEELMDYNNKQCHSVITNRMLQLVDILIDGEFVVDEKDLNLRFRGSRNQRIIDVQKTLASNEIVIAEEYM